MSAVAERDQILQFLAGVSILIGTPIVVVMLVIRGIVKRRRALALWRECARRHGWSAGPGSALLSGVSHGLTWSLAVEGSDDDEIVWRAQVSLADRPLDEDRLRDAAEHAHRNLPRSLRERFAFRDFTFSAEPGAISVRLQNRDLPCEAAAELVNFGLAAARLYSPAGPS